MGRPITARGRYIDLKSGVVTVSMGSEEQRADPSAATFGSGRRSVLVPLEMGRWHEWAQRWSVTATATDTADATDAADALELGKDAADAQPEDVTPVAYLPQRGGDPRQPKAATPVSLKIVRRADPKRVGGYRYDLHVAFRMALPLATTRNATEGRPLLAINRGFRHLYAAVVTTPDAASALACQVVSGQELLRIQQALEQRRQQRQRHGVRDTQAQNARRVSARDRRQSRISDQHCVIAANEIVALARRFGAQVVMEDFTRLNVRGLPYLLQPIMHLRPWEKLAKRIAERLEVAGLPPARRVSASYISRDCPRCGVRQDARMVAKSERPHQFDCEHCGESQDRDVSAAANIARRWVWMRQWSADKRTGIAVEQRMSWEEFARKYPVRDLHTPGEGVHSPVP